VNTRTSTARIGVLGAVVCSSLAICAGCGDFYSVHGRVRSCADRTPVVHASVHLTQKTEHRAVTTDGDGAFKVSIDSDAIEAPAELRIEKKGFQTLTKSVNHNLGLSEDVCIHPGSKPRAE
jgi:hypothetical protein